MPTFLCGRQRKVGAAPHRGNANRPLTIQGKAKKPAQQQPRRTGKKKLTPAGGNTQPQPPTQPHPPQPRQRTES
ncbi:MAG: hypothetical protein DI523_16680 [Paraburkholderia fungorum]|nr:MAG: hypothetical protein DI523_16680 [Paraburkholderia fungorum]